jgi:acyl-CoA dehydrogenase
MGIPFPNGPTSGRGVVVPADAIIGGVDYAGRGWRMLMEALSGGRAVSLPAQAVAGAKSAVRIAGAYSVVRRQFGLSIGRFEGVEEPLGRIAGTSYLMEAARVFTCGALASGHRPAVVSAIMKYNETELARHLAIDTMDVLGGAAICRGPRNLIADGYSGAPIGITVEGANILTRTLIVFGQGAMRCHPHVHALLESVRQGDLPTFRRVLLAQGWHVLRNAVRCGVLGVSRGRLAGSPVRGETARYYRRLAWASARFAFHADLALFLLGSSLKTRGKLTGRFADMLSWMYLGFATLRRFEAEGRRAEDLPLVAWGVETSLAYVQESFEGILQNFGVPFLGAWLRGPALVWARLNPMGAPPSDRLGAAAAATIRKDGEQRERLTDGLFKNRDGAMGLLEDAFELSLRSDPVLTKVRRAVRRGELPKASPESLLGEALAAGVVTREEADLAERARAARHEAIQVDSFSAEEWLGETAEERPRSVAVA